MMKRFVAAAAILLGIFTGFANPAEAAEETGETFLENALIKARAAYELTGLPSLADDSGLEVDFLNGEPGVFSSRYAGENCDDKKNIEKLLINLNDVPLGKRTARFRCIMVLKGPGFTDRIVSGTCEGSIAFKPRGYEGFGYDPVFIPEGYNKTFAEMEPSQKNGISHRSEALQSLKEELYELFGK